MASRQRLFTELGLLDETEEVNPYETLGIDAGFAQELLKEDPSGSTLRSVTGAISRVLSRQYHPDVGETADVERFRLVQAAHESVTNATPTELRRWSKVERVASSIRLEKMREASNARVEGTSELVRLNMELGHDPRHFSQLRWTQGVLARHNKATLLLRTQQQGLDIVRGQHVTDGLSGQPLGSFHGFMHQQSYFGVEPGTRTATYIDGKGRATLLRSDLGFIMDITAPVQSFAKRRARSKTPEEASWARSEDPLLITTTFPEADFATPAETQLVVFSGKNRRLATKWELPLDISGSVADPSFYKRIRHRSVVGAFALTGPGAQQSHFNVIPTSTQEMVDQDAGYSPLVTPGNSLVLYDQHNRVPVATDVRILGMLGNGPQSV